MEIKLAGPAVAICRNEVGELGAGRLLTNKVIRCFGQLGRLSDDGESILWGDGSLWMRDHGSTF